MPRASGAVQIIWLCRSPWGVSPSLTGSQAARAGSAAGGPPLPGHRSELTLCATRRPSVSHLTARPHVGQMAVAFAMLPMSLAVPRPDGGSKGTPAIAGGQLATGRPGQVAPSTITRLPAFPCCGSYLPSQAGRKTRLA